MFNKKLISTIILLIFTISVLLPSNAIALIKKEQIIKLYLNKTSISTQIKQKLAIKYRLSKNAKAIIEVLNNQKVIKTLNNRIQKKGIYSIKWNGKDNKGKTLPNGKYTLRLKAVNAKQRSIIARKIRVINKLIFSEYFDGADKVMADEYINNGIDPAGRWDATSGVLKISGNYGYTDSPVFRVVTQKSDFTNFTLSTSLLKKTSAIEDYEGLQLFFRYQDQYNLYVAGIRNDNMLHLKKKVNDEYFTLATVPFNSNKLNYWYKMKVIASGNHIQILVDGIKYVDVYDNSHTRGKLGIRTDNIQALFNDFLVFSL